MLSMDCVSFNEKLEYIIASNSPPPGSTRQNQSPWLFTEEAHTLFETAKRRVFSGKLPPSALASEGQPLPSSVRLVLEEQPKWFRLAEALDEIERDKFFDPSHSGGSSESVLIMCGSVAESQQIKHYLRTMHDQLKKRYRSNDEENGEQEASAAVMMHQRMLGYISRQSSYAKASALFSGSVKPIAESNVSTNSKPVGDWVKGRAPPNKRRRTRGGIAATITPRSANGTVPIPEFTDDMAQEMLNEGSLLENRDDTVTMIPEEGLDDIDKYFGLLRIQDLVAVHHYDGDMDDQLLEEAKPRYIIMYTPDPAFVRRVEVYRSSHTDRNIRVYFMFYEDSVEERRYLSSVRREKDSFTKLISERSVSFI